MIDHAKRIARNFTNIWMLFGAGLYLFSLKQRPIGGEITAEQTGKGCLGAGMLFRFLLELVDLVDNLREMFNSEEPVEVHPIP